jgi:Tfp pilus assembly protein PilZ
VSFTQPRYPASLRVAFSDAGRRLSGTVTNISSGGMFVRIDGMLPVGALLTGALELPDGDRPAPVQAKVVHSVPPLRLPPSERGIGMQFVGKDDALGIRLDRYIHSIVQSSKAPVDLLLMARDLLHEKGWTQFIEQESSGSYCLSGALWRAAGEDRDSYRAALESMGPRLNVPPCPHGGFACHCAVLSWNDRQGRTKRQVIAKLDEVINAALGANAPV